MTNFEETTKSLSLEENQVHELTSWINNISLSTKVPADKIKELFVDKTGEAITAGLQNDQTLDMFLEFVKSHVMSETMQILPPPPGKSIELMPFGYFAARPGAKGTKQEPKGEIMAWGKLEDTGVSVASIMAFGNESLLKRAMIEPCEVYKTVIGFNPEKRTANLIRGSIHKETAFDGNKIDSPNFPKTIATRWQNIIANYPLIPLSKASVNISRLIQSDKARGQKSRPFPDSTDLKVIQVRITDVMFGRRISDQAEWCKISVVDSTFMPQTNHKAFSVWFDPMLARKIGAGKDSFVKIIGTLQHDMNQQFIEMNGCAIFPEKLSPLVETAQDLSGASVSNIPAGMSKPLNIAL